MKKITTLGSLCLFVGILINSCYYDKYNEIHPLDGYRNPCDSAVDTTYTQSVRYIMAYNCTSCHSSSFSQGNIKLDTYEGVMSTVSNGKLKGSIEQQTGYIAMPPGTKIPSCQIDKINAWLVKGSPQ